MKKTFLLMKMLFFLALLCVGQGAWAQTTVTYDFTSFSARTLSNSGTKAFSANGVNHNYASNLPEVYNRFAFQFAGTFSIETDGLYAQRDRGDHVGICGLASGDKVTINFSQGAIMVRGDITNWTGNTSAWTSYTTGTEIPINAAGNLSFQAKTLCKISSIVITTNATESMTAPSIDSEANGSARTVTITDGASSLLSPVTTYYTTDGTDPTTSSTKYTEPFDVDATCTVKAITISNSSAATASTVTSQEIDMDAVDVPTAAITAVDGINRTVTFSCTTVGATLYYSTDNGENYTEGTSLVISADTNIKVKATKGSASAESESLAFEAGTEIVLNAPTWTKTGYSEGVSTVTLADDQSGKLLSPVSTIMYQINDGAEQAYSSAISVNDGETLKYWSVATGYTNSAVGSVVAATPNTNETIIAENYVGVVSENNNLSLADGEGYRKIYYNGGADLVSENLLASNINSGNYYQMYRANGLYTSFGWNLAIPNLKAGDYVTLNGVYGNGAFSISGASNMTADLWNSTAGSKYCYTVNADGDVTFSMGRYGYLTSITIQRASKADIVYTAPVAVEGLVANGEAQALVTAGTVEAGGEMQYSLDGENFSTEIPTAIEAGEYTVYFKIVADATHNDVAAQTIVVTVAAPKAEIIYTAPEAVEGLVANGEAQALITAGTVEAGGEMQYSLDGENFSTAIPTATEAKKYTVYYRIVADDTHNDVAAQEIFVTIITAELDAAQKELVAAIEAAKAIDTEGKNGAEELAAAIKTAEGVIFADDVTVSAVNTAKENLAAAVAAFEEANKVAYDITVAESIVGGTVEVSSTSAKAGEEVTITATPADGYELASVSVTGVTSNEAVIVTDGKFTMPEDAVTVSATFKKKAIYIETDLTSQFSALTDYTNWTGATGFTATNFCPAVAINDGTTKQVCEKYEGTCATTGDVFYQTITGLAAGTYKIELYGGAAYTFGRGFSSEAFSEGTWNAGDKIEPSAEVSTGVVLSATTSEGTYGGEIPIYYATNFPDGAATVTLDGVKVGANGELRIGMSKTSQSTNWHVVQLKGVTAQVDAIELHAVTLASAQAALSAEVNAVVVGEEKTALEAAIANNSEVTELTSEAYETAINALKAATNAFTSAREAYAALASTKESLVEYAKKYVYASAEKTAAVTAAAEGEPTSAADATSKNANLIAALRAMAESHAKAEGVEGAEAIAITNPSAEDSTNGWTTVKGEGSGGSINILENEPWTSADGSTAHKYFDGGNWGASAWDVSLTQDVELGAGKYMLSAIGRASGDVALTLFAGENKAAMPAINATGGLFDRGWNLSSVEFEVEAKSTVTIGVQGVTSVVHNWMSFSDFKLVLIESHAIKDAKAELLEAINEAKAIDTEYKDGAEELAAAITVAEGVYNNQEATVEGVNTAKSDLAAAVAAFNTANAKYSALTYTITGQSSIKATIKKGKAVLDIIPEEGWAVSELKVNGEDALEQLADNKLVVNVDADATLVEVTFGWADAENMYEEDEVTGIATIADEGIKVYAQGNQICVEGAAGKVVRVYTLYGSLLKAATPSENKVAKFSVAAGTYVVQVGNKAAKISVK